MRQLFGELKRRNVYRVAVTYVVAAFVVLQLADLAAGAFGFPGWFEPMIWVVAGLGFPIALVIAWAFELTPEGVRRTTETDDAEGAAEAESTSPEQGRARSRLAMKALVGLGLVGAAVVGGWYLTGGGGESPEVSDNTVAVLPFEVTGSGAEDLRDGMVSLLSTGLDGAGGLRAIADRTVLAAWETAGAGARGVSTDEALSVAREVGAEHAVIGSAAALAGELQLTVDVHATRSGERLERVEVRGSPDSVSGLTHELARDVIAVLASDSEEASRSVELASVLTESVDALKLYLSGLEHERVVRTTAAIEDYEAAIREDSTFALPYARIGFLGLWHEAARDEAMRRAFELADRLPERERRLVRALHLGRVEHRTVAAADSLRRLTEDYPDDPWIWTTLGEFVLHAYIPGGWPEGEEAHRQALQLDPENSGLYDHYVSPAFVGHHDSALAARRVEEMPDGQMKRLYRLGLEAAFGTPETRERTLARYDTISVPASWMAYGPLRAPETTGLLDEVLRRLLERDDLDPAFYERQLLFNDVRQGRRNQLLSDLERREVDDGTAACVLAYAAAYGMALPDSVRQRYLASDRVPAEPVRNHLFCAALHGLERDRPEAVEQLLERLRAASGGDAEFPAAQREALIQEFEGLRAWKEGDLERAAELLSRSNESAWWGALWRGDLYRELGELETAEGWYRVWQMPVVAYERLGELYEQMGRPEDAAAAYRRFVAAWEEADPELQGRVEAARERMEQLDGSGPASGG